MDGPTSSSKGKEWRPPLVSECEILDVRDPEITPLVQEFLLKLFSGAHESDGKTVEELDAVTEQQNVPVNSDSLLPLTPEDIIYVQEFIQDKVWEAVSSILKGRKDILESALREVVLEDVSDFVAHQMQQLIATLEGVAVTEVTGNSDRYEEFPGLRGKSTILRLQLKLGSSFDRVIQEVGCICDAPVEAIEEFIDRAHRGITTIWTRFSGREEDALAVALLTRAFDEEDDPVGTARGLSIRSLQEAIDMIVKINGALTDPQFQSFAVHAFAESIGESS